MAKKPCESTFPSDDGQRVVGCMWTEDHASHHEGIDHGAPGGPAVVRWDKQGRRVRKI